MLKRIFTNLPAPFFLFIIVILAYGIYIPWFGFYGDDWSYIWYQHLLGFGGAGDFASYDRPFSAMYYNVVIFLLGEGAWPYQIFALTLRWLSAVLLWWVLTLVWKNKPGPCLWTAALFAIYPGFGQQPIAVEFILHFAVLDLFLFSLAGMLISVQMPRKTNAILTLLSMIALSSVFGLEYFIGLEILRPIFLWKVLAENYPQRVERLKKVFISWLPYLVVIFAFLYWRIFIFQFPTYKPGLFKDILSNPASTLPGLLIRVMTDLKEVSLDAWRQVLRYPPGKILSTYLAIILGSFVFITFFFYRWIKTHLSETVSFWKEWPLEAIGIGLTSMLAAGLPFWVTGIPLEISFPWDRTTLPFMLGACLVMVALMELIIHPRFLPFFMAGIISLCLGMQLVNADIYRQEWDQMKSFYWQLTWRAPALKPGTIILSDQIPLYKVSDSGMTAPLNWIYAPDYHSRNLLYKVFDLDVRLDGDYAGIPGLKNSLPIEHNYRSLFFQSSTDSLLVFHDKRNTCLHVLSPKDAVVSGLPEKVVRILPLSNLNLIIPAPEQSATPPRIVFGDEPEHGWCYLYEKADLARQQKNWKQVGILWKQASDAALRPLDPMELLPFIEGLAYEKDFEQARQLSLQVNEVAGLRTRLCMSWKEINLNPELQPDSANIASIMTELECY